MNPPCRGLGHAAGDVASFGERWNHRRRSVLGTAACRGFDFAAALLVESQPVNPPARAMEAPFAPTAETEYQGPCWPVQLKPVLPLGRTVEYRAWPIAALAIRSVLDVSAGENDRYKRPWMVVKGSVFVAPAELVEIDPENC